MTHDELVLKAGWYLRKRIRCYPVLMEACYGNSREQPDAIGWRDRTSYVIECKASRTDFLSDGNKPHREYGMGSYRYYMAPHGIIHADEIPDGWGYLEVRGKSQRVYEVLEAGRRRLTEEALYNELALCRGALTNVQLRDRGFQLSESRHQVANLGRGYNQLYRELAGQIRKSVIADMQHSLPFGLEREQREQHDSMIRAIERSAARAIPHEGYLRIMN